MRKLYVKILCLSMLFLVFISFCNDVFNEVDCTYNNYDKSHVKKKAYYQNSNIQLTSSCSDEWNFNSVINSIEHFRSVFPSKNEGEIADLVYDSLYIKQKYIYGLTPSEFKIIFNELGLQGFFKIRDIVNEVTKVTLEIYGNSGFQDDSDAFRHVYLTASLYKNVSKKFAYELMTAHESETIDLLDKEMDLHNNSRGITLYDKWLSLQTPGNLKDYITHCVYNGYFYNIKKIVTNNGISKLVYTDNGINDVNYLNQNTISLTYNPQKATLAENDFQWYAFCSNNKSGTFNISSIGSVDLFVELYSSRTKESTIIGYNNDNENSLNFSLNFDLTYYETIYIKVGGYYNNTSGDYQICISEINVSQAPSFIYLKYNNKYHIRVDESGKRVQEPHAISGGSGRYTKCVLCDEDLDVYVDGPFFVKYDNKEQVLFNKITQHNNNYIYLSKQEWEQYIEGLYFK